MTEDLLRVEGLCKRYGGLTVTDGVSLTVRAGEIHAVIGPNGAGKTTLIGQLTGEIRPDAGRILFDDADITPLPVHDRARRGLARSFQITSVFRSFTAEGNVALAVQAGAGHHYRFWSPARQVDALRRPARALLAQVGLAGRLATPAAAMAHGEHRQLELAMALAGQPRLLLLDEPMAGLGPDDTARMVAFLRTLKPRCGILLVEHDMDAVFALADRISVLAAGRIIATGDAAAIRTSREVRTAYLGEDDDA